MKICEILQILIGILSAKCYRQSCNVLFTTPRDMSVVHNSTRSVCQTLNCLLFSWSISQESRCLARLLPRGQVLLMTSAVHWRRKFRLCGGRNIICQLTHNAFRLENILNAYVGPKTRFSKQRMHALLKTARISGTFRAGRDPALPKF